MWMMEITEDIWLSTPRSPHCGSGDPHGEVHLRTLQEEGARALDSAEDRADSDTCSEARSRRRR